MGGRGSRSGGGAGGGAGGGNINAMWRQAFQPVPPPVLTPGQPVPAITQQQLQAMTDQEFATYLAGLKSTPIDKLTYYNDNWDTQRLIANMPELNRAPDVVDPQSFAQLPGEALYRTVNITRNESAVDICARTMTSDVTTIGAGRMGDGFYFANSLHGSQVNYGKYRGDINRTATMAVKLNSNAKPISESSLTNMLYKESSTVRNAVYGMKSNGDWSGSGLMAYALRKGYNVVHSGSYYNIIDRSVATFSGGIVPWT